MHFTEPVYRNPYWPTWPLIQITQGCTHNHCKFCTMYRDVPFRMMKVEDIEEDAKEIAAQMPHAKTIQLLSANPLALSYENLAPRLEAIRRHLPELEFMYTATRVSDLKNKSVEELKKLRELGIREISLGVESGDDWTLDRSHSREHAIHSAEIFNQLHPMVVGTGGLTLFPGTPLLEEAYRGEFDPLDEKELMEELLLFLETLECDCRLITHHTVSMDLNGDDFLSQKNQIIAALKNGIEHFDMETLSRRRQNKRTL